MAEVALTNSCPPTFMKPNLCCGDLEDNNSHFVERAVGHQLVINGRGTITVESWCSPQWVGEKIQAIKQRHRR